VPELLAARKDRAAIFLLAWRRHVGPGELIYTRTPEAYRILLKARVRAFSGATTGVVRTLNRWQLPTGGRRRSRLDGIRRWMFGMRDPT
jgi:hypothetical protein